MNGDGILDIVCSDYACNINFFEGTADKKFKNVQKFKKTNGQNLEFENSLPDKVYGAVAVSDWNGDGLFDILFTAQHIPLTLFLNKGTITDPVFEESDKILINGAEVLLKRPSFVVYDIDVDGKKDLVFGGGDKKVNYALNTGTDDAPQFESFTPCPLNNGTYIEHGTQVHGETQVCVCDWNSDGYPDLLVGENCGWTMNPPWEYLYLFLGIDDGSVDNKHKVQSINLTRNRAFSFTNSLRVITIYSDAECEELKVFNASGKLVKSFTVTQSVGSSSRHYSLNDLARGVYSVHYKGKGTIFSQMIIIH